MKLVIVNGFKAPHDPCKKNRFAAILGMKDGRVIVAPCTTYFERTGVVPRGSVLITKESPAFAATGFTREKVCISLRDAALYSIDSEYIKGITQTGMLDLSKDKRLKDLFKRVAAEYDL